MNQEEHSEKIMAAIDAVRQRTHRPAPPVRSPSAFTGALLVGLALAAIHLLLEFTR